ncbi:MAG: arylsulfatase A-like enzyme [Planctomycetota bacterium]|jgi:arylsulfatase A-like enzyme
MKLLSIGKGMLAPLVVMTSLGCSESTSEAPNVLLYVSDTLRADSLACYGNAIVETPHLDQLASEGVLYEQAFAPSSWTRASMGSILSGTMPAVHGAEGRYDLLDESVVLISEILGSQGYDTAGITTNRNVGSFFGFDQGFEAGGFIELYEPSTKNMVMVAELVTRADDVTRAAIDWLEQASEPFCLIVHTIDPHSPYTPPEEWDRYGDGIASSATGTHEDLFALGKKHTQADVERILSLYYGEIAFNDAAIGELLDWLKQRGMYDRTITVFTSDHGEEFWELGERGHGKTVNEKSLHVPLLVRFPSKLEATRTSDFVSTVDILPTILELANAEAPEWLRGASLVGSARKEIFASCLLGNRELLSLRGERWKLVKNLKQNSVALYDLHQKQGEGRDVARQHQSKARELNARVEQLMLEHRQERLQLHGTKAVQEVGELPDEVDEDLRKMGYLGSDEE